MTLKQLVKRLNQEQFDIKKADVQVHLSSGEKLDVVDVSLDKDKNIVVLTVSGATTDVRIFEEE